MSSTEAVERALHLSFVEIASDAPWLVAVSGGVDSISLGFGSALVADALGLRIVFAHFNHKTRSAEEHLRDRECVRLLAERVGVPMVYDAAEEQFSSAPGGPESAARELRYRFFERAAGATGACGMMTAHTRDDQIETIAMRLLSGIGGALLSGIAARTKRGTLLIVRPFLNLSKQTLFEYARTHSLSWSEDRSNESTRFRRNFVRRELLPSAVAEWPALGADLLAIGSAARARMSTSVDQASGIRWVVRSGTIEVDADSFFAAGEGARLHVLYKLLRSLSALRRENRPSHRFFAPLLGPRPNRSGVLIEGRGLRFEQSHGRLCISRLLSASGKDGIFPS